MRDRSQILDQFVVRHADAVVSDYQQRVGFVWLQHDLQRRVVRNLAVRQREMPKLVERIRSIRDQLANRNLAILIQRVRQQVQQLFDLSLKREFLRSGSGHVRHPYFHTVANVAEEPMQ